MGTRQQADVAADDAVTVEVNCCLGLIVLNQAQAGNVLSTEVLLKIERLLLEWERLENIHAVALLGLQTDPTVQAVFSVGADLPFLATYARQQPRAEPLGCWLDALARVSHRIHHFPKPFIALVDGQAGGSALGLIQGAKLRVLSERSTLAFSHLQDGLIPDAGLSHYLAQQCPGFMGEWLMLGGEVVAAGDAMSLGLGDVVVPMDSWQEMLAELRHGHQPNAEHVVATVMERAELASDSRCLARRPLIDSCFGRADAIDILEALRHEGSDWALSLHARLSSCEPLSMSLALELLRRGRQLNLTNALILERKLAYWALEAPKESDHETPLVAEICKRYLNSDSPVVFSFD